MTTDALTDSTFHFSRTIDGPRELVWQASTTLDHLAKWWGPKGCTLSDCRLDFRPGGQFHYCMHMPTGEPMWGLFVYDEIDPPARISFKSSFADADGQIIRAPFSENWPLEVMNRWHFTELDGRTTIDIEGRPHQATAAEHEIFRAMHASMRMGFGGTLDKLAGYLQGLKQEVAK